ncbi:glycerophosphodiester phosphodiesterase [Zobellella iuensis]|uniref:glycerophosphodiester phosphodiesterase n=1 Tax=Zobellella iuensis TaxID=2803811 RepID=A0ABS1QQ56_9GAMM|nr:glycerophosphodiester phosphodiesterase [Zobellella iuensis]MBL1377000.1 glycerophosphodiester phosphodiesterase [Zobellella iuensis]
MTKTVLSGLLATTLLCSPWLQAEQIVVAHRGASGYLPEHTLAAKALAYAMKPHYLEQDLVMTKDDRLVVLHDHYLDRVSDVAERFPGRAREDGRYYAIDFTLDEIRQLRATEVFNQDEEGKQGAVYPGRFPLWQSSFRIPTFEEEIELIQGLNKSLGYDIGIYPEIKAPWLHHQHGKDIARATLEVLKRYGYTEQDSKVYLQTFDYNELKRIKEQLLPEYGMDIKLVMLLAHTDWDETFEQDAQGQWIPYDYDWMFEPDAMATLARHADGVGPWMPMVVADGSTPGNIELTGLAARAQAAGLEVHPYTLRLDEGRLPAYAENFEQLLDVFYNQARVDGVFTDFPDRAVAFLERQAE